MGFARCIGWTVFVGCAFFALSAHSYYLFGGWEAAGAAIYGGLVGLGFAFATKRIVPYRFGLRSLISLAWIVSCSLLYQYIFAKEIGYDTSRRELVVTGAVVASLPALVWLVRRKVTYRPIDSRTET